MGKPAIVEKITREMDQRITSERQVVYILGQTRKLLELEKRKSEYPALNFYCNWVLHSRLTTSAEARRILDIFDRAEQFHTAIDNTADGEEIKNPDWTWISELGPEVELTRFRAEFQAFCEYYGVEGRLVSSQNSWFEFLRHYAGVIEDVPLVCHDDTLQYVNEVITRRIPIPLGLNASEVGKVYIFAIQWEWMAPSGVPRRTQKIFQYELTGWTKYWRFVRARIKYFWRVRLLRTGPFE